MIPKQSISILAGFILLFLLYHGAEYRIVFKQDAMGFLAFHALFIGSAYVIGRWQFGQGLKAWGFQITRKTLLQMAWGLCIGILLYGLSFFTAIVCGIEQVLAVPPPGQILSMLGLFVFGNFFASFSEDVLTRAYVYKHLNGTFSAVPLTFVSASIYVLNHINRLNEGPDTYLYLFLLGVLLMIPLVKTKQIWMTGAIHWGGNCTFYLTHEIFKTDQAPSGVSPNTILLVFILIWIAILTVFRRSKPFSLL